MADQENLDLSYKIRNFSFRLRNRKFKTYFQLSIDETNANP